MSKSFAAPNDRLDVVDALRGFALLGIVIVHFIEQFYAGPPPAGRENFIYHQPTDGFIDMLTNILIRGKFFMLFSFLFGLSFYLQLSRAEAKGESFQGRYLWRLIILLAIGMFHNSFYRGDILALYAVLGIPMIVFYRVPNTFLLLTAALMMVVPRLIVYYINPNADFESQIKQMQVTEASYWHAVKNLSFIDAAWWNNGYGISSKSFFQFGFNGRGYQTFAMFLLGIYAGRLQFFDNTVSRLKQIKKLFWWSLGLFVGLFLLGMLLFSVLKIHETMPQAVMMFIGMSLYDIGNVINTAFYIAAFMWLFQKAWWQRQFLKLAPYGRMALTNYVIQSIIGTFIFFGWGLGLLGEIGVTVTVGISLIVFIAQRIFSKWWLQHYYFGPFEWLWRSLTFMKLQPFKK
jgi:uncharacterized protein